MEDGPYRPFADIIAGHGRRHPEKEAIFCKDLIVRGGVNIAPLEIDGVIFELPEVAEACTVGVPDPIYGEEVVSYVSLKPGSDLTGEAIRAHCVTRLPQLKTPKEIVIQGSLLRTRGKLDRNMLTEDWKRAHDL